MCDNLYCFICGLPSCNKSYLNKCSILTVYNDVVHDCEYVEQNIFYKNKISYLALSNNYKCKNTDSPEINMIRCLFIHTMCYKFVETQYKISLTYSMIPFFILPKLPSKLINNPLLINYGKIVELWNDDIEEIDDKILDFSKNKSRIKKIISQLKLKKDKGRKSPNISATFFKENMIKIGIDNNMWIIKNNKWIKYSDELETVKYEGKLTPKIKKYIDSLYFLHQYSEIPVFITNLLIKEPKLDSFKIELLIDKNYKIELDKIL